MIRDYIQTNIPWAGQYRAAVDEVIASPNVQSGPAFVEFAEVSRANDGPVIGQRVSSNESRLLCTLTGSNALLRNLL